MLISCGNSAKKISVFIYASDDTFINSLGENIKDKLKSNNIENSFYYAERSQNIQNDQITEAIESRENKLLLVNSVDRLADATIMDKAKLFDLPIIFFNREPLDNDLKNNEACYYVGSNPLTEGKIQAQLASNLFYNPYNLSSKYDKNGDNKIQIVLLKGEQGHQDMENRSKYCIQGLKDKGYNVDILTTSYANWTRKEAYMAMESIYGTYGDQIELLFSNNDDMALGAIDYLLDNGIFFKTVSSVEEQPFPIIGVDATEVGRLAIQDHLLYGTVKNDKNAQADAIYSLIDHIINNKVIDKDFPYEINNVNKIYIEGESVTIENL